MKEEVMKEEVMKEEVMKEEVMKEEIMQIDPTVPETPNGVSPEKATQPESKGRRPRRLQRIRDYLEEALAKPESLAACLAAHNADTMRLCYRLARATDAALASAPDTIEKLPTVYQALDMVARLNRQIQQFSELDVRLRAAAAEAPTVGGTRSSDKSRWPTARATSSPPVVAIRPRIQPWRRSSFTDDSAL
jgi:hypothetical protein